MERRVHVAGVGMIPSREESLGHRLFVTVFLSVVMSSLVLILPATFCAHTSVRRSGDRSGSISRASDVSRLTSPDSRSKA